jgi:6,7-dimethyl-8-ribityllumazine synthase
MPVLNGITGCDEISQPTVKVRMKEGKSWLVVSLVCRMANRLSMG